MAYDIIEGVVTAPDRGRASERSRRPCRRRLAACPADGLVDAIVECVTTTYH
jgi:hypothetical protein